MAIRFQCPKCDSTYKTSERNAGKSMRCRFCGTKFEVLTETRALKKKHPLPRGVRIFFMIFGVVGFLVTVLSLYVGLAFGADALGIWFLITGPLSYSLCSIAVSEWPVEGAAGMCGSGLISVIQAIPYVGSNNDFPFMFVSLAMFFPGLLLFCAFLRFR